jgi:hypothetical protein
MGPKYARNTSLRLNPERCLTPRKSRGLGGKWEPEWARNPASDLRFRDLRVRRLDYLKIDPRTYFPEYAHPSSWSIPILPPRWVRRPDLHARIELSCDPGEWPSVWPSKRTARKPPDAAPDITAEPPPEQSYFRRGDGGLLLCFKCGERRRIERGFVVCGPCRQRVPSSPDDAFYDCGCAWNYDRYVMLDAFVLMGSTVVARPPSDSCTACEGRGKISNRHRHLQIRRSVGATGNDGDRYSTADRHGHFHPTADKDHFLADGGWKIESLGATGKSKGARAQGIGDRETIIDAAVESQTFIEITKAEYLEMKDNGGPEGYPRGKRELQQFRANVIRRAVRHLDGNVSTEALAEIFGFKDRRRVQQILNVSPKSPKGGNS